MFYRANLFQKSIGIISQSEIILIKKIIEFHHSLVSISDVKLTIKTIKGEILNYNINFLKNDTFTSTHIVEFSNDIKFRLIQPIGISLDIFNAQNNALGGFSLGSMEPDGWAIHFFFTEKEDLRQINILHENIEDQIQKLIDNSLFAIKIGLPHKFIDYSKRIFSIIKKNPSQIYDYKNSYEFIEIIKFYLFEYNDIEKIIINRILERF